MPSSVLEAIKQGIWNFEPTLSEVAAFEATRALPGSEDKLEILAERVQRGLPLWHPHDRRSFDESDTLS